MEQPSTEKQSTPTSATQPPNAEKDPLLADTAVTTPIAAAPAGQQQSTAEILVSAALVIIIIVLGLLFVFTLIVSAYSAGRYVFASITPGGHTFCLPDNSPGAACVTWSASAVDDRAYGETYAVQLNAAVLQACEDYCSEKGQGKEGKEEMVCSGVYVGRTIGAKFEERFGQMNACKVARVAGRCTGQACGDAPWKEEL